MKGAVSFVCVRSAAFPFFSTSLYLLFPLICVSLPTSYIFSRTIIIPPMQSEPTHFHLPACVCVHVCVLVCPLSKVVKYSKDRDLF